MTTTWRGSWSPADRAESIYQYVGFSVGTNVEGVAVEVEFDQSQAVLDLGLFDPRGFRGYSGGARTRFAVSAEAATPGYLPGPVPTGEWQILFGLHRVPDAGVDVTVRITTGGVSPQVDGGVDFDLPEAVPPGRTRQLPAAAGRQWLAGDLHAHTVHSDGALTIDQLAGLAARLGLDFLAVTDHNTISHHAHLPAAGARAGVLLLPGQEVTTDEGHANCFGSVGWVDFRRSSEDWLDHAQDRGGLLSINHPLAGDCRWRRPLARGTPLAEVWHSSWDRRSHEPLRWWEEWGGAAIGGSDWHRPGEAQMLGRPTTWAETADGDVLGALAAGRVAVSATTHGPVMVPHDGVLVVDSGSGFTVVDGAGDRQRVRGDRFRAAVGRDPHLLVDDAGSVHALVT